MFSDSDLSGKLENSVASIGEKLYKGIFIVLDVLRGPPVRQGLLKLSCLQERFYKNWRRNESENDYD